MPKNIEQYLDMNDDDLDNLLLGLDVTQKSDDYIKNVCKNCKSSNLVIDNSKGHMVCTDCAVINEEYLDENPDINNAEGETSSSSRYGCPTSYFFPNASLGTKIVSKKGFNRLSLVQKQGQIQYREVALMKVLEVIQNNCKKYGITQPIIDTAKIFYKKIYDKKHVKGKRMGKNIIMRRVNKLLIKSGCLFNACKVQGEPRTVKEIADIFGIEIKHVNRGCRKFAEIIDENTLFYQIKSSQSSDFIERFAKKLNIDKKYIDIAKDVSNNIHKLDLASTHEPPSIAAGCILLVVNIYNIQLSKKQISDIFGISDVTISKTYRKIYPYHKIILSNKITDLIIEKKNTIKPDNNNTNLIINSESDETTNNKNLIKDDSEEDSIYSEDDDSDYSDFEEEICQRSKNIEI
jgi:transcription initiation factor TFIIB